MCICRCRHGPAPLPLILTAYQLQAACAVCRAFPPWAKHKEEPAPKPAFSQEAIAVIGTVIIVGAIEVGTIVAGIMLLSQVGRARVRQGGWVS